MIDIRLSGVFLAPFSCPPSQTLPLPTTALPSSLKVLSSLNFIEVGQPLQFCVTDPVLTILISFAQHYDCVSVQLHWVIHSQGCILLHLSIHHNLFNQGIYNLRDGLETTQMPFKCNSHRICTCSTSEATDNPSILLSFPFFPFSHPPPLLLSSSLLLPLLFLFLHFLFFLLLLLQLL